MTQIIPAINGFMYISHQTLPSISVETLPLLALPLKTRYQSGVEKVTPFNLFSFDLVPGFEGQDKRDAEGYSSLTKF